MTNQLSEPAVNGYSKTGGIFGTRCLFFHASAIQARTERQMLKKPNKLKTELKTKEKAYIDCPSLGLLQDTACS